MLRWECDMVGPMSYQLIIHRQCAYSVYLLIKGSEKSCKTPMKLRSAHFGKCMLPPASLCPTFPFHSCLESVWASGTSWWRQESSDLGKSLLRGTVGILLANPVLLFFFKQMRKLQRGNESASPRVAEEVSGRIGIWTTVSRAGPGLLSDVTPGRGLRFRPSAYAKWGLTSLAVVWWMSPPEPDHER